MAVTVRPGDTLTAIAQRNGVSLQELIAANPQISNPNMIYQGQVINLPSDVSPAGDTSGADNPNVPAEPQVDPAEAVRQYAAENYGYLASYLDHPEIGSILTQASTEGWSDEKLFGALYETDWWQSTSNTARQWDAMVETDPASANEQIEKRYQDLVDYAYRTGLGVSDAAIRSIATDSLRMGWSQNQINDALFAQATQDNARIGSDLSTASTQVTQIFSSYGLTPNPTEVSQLATDIILGRQSIEGVNEIATRRAISVYPQLSEVILNGDLNALAYNYQNVIAQYTGIPADSIDLFNDPRWTHVLTGPEPMNLHDLRTELRGTPEYGSSPEGRGNAAQMAMLLTEQLGVAAY